MEFITLAYFPTLTGVTTTETIACTQSKRAHHLSFQKSGGPIQRPLPGYETYVTREVTTAHTSVPKVAKSASMTVTNSAMVS